MSQAVDAPEGALLASVAAHSLGKLPVLSAQQFQTLCRDMQGAFPDLVRRSFNGVVEHGAATSSSNRAEFDICGPEPSPVDYDWRFDQRTAIRLAEALIGPSNREVLCLGAPTVYGAIQSLGGKSFLVDRNPLLTRNLVSGTYCIADISTEEELDLHVGRKFDVAVIDPPWHVEAYDLWLARTLPLLRTGAEVFVAMFRKFTRPGGLDERAQLLQRFEKIGRVSAEPFEAGYSTPPFEQEVLLRLGLPHLPSWRVADIYKISLHQRPELSVFRPDGWPSHKWKRFILEGQVIALKDIPDDDGLIQVASEFPSCIKTVSQRDPARAFYTVWTSRSYAAVVRGTKRLAAILGGAGEVTVEPSDLQAAIELSRDLGFQLRR
jgi:hypothetical protein